MKMKVDAVYINSEIRVGMKDPSKSFYPCLLASGTETLEVLCADESVYEKLSQVPLYSPIIACLDYNTRFKGFRLIDIIQPQQKAKA